MAFTSTYAVLTTDEANFITEYNKKKLLPVIEHNSLMAKLVDKDPGNFPSGSGTTMVLRRRLPRTLDTADLATTLQFTDATPQKFKGQTITANLRTLQGATEYSKLVKKVDINELRDIRNLVAIGAAESFDKDLIDVCSPLLTHVRADWDTSSPYQKIFISTTGCTTTSIAAAAILTQADDYWGGNSTYGYIMDIGRSDPNYGIAESVTDFATSGDLLTVATYENTPTDLGDTFLVCIGTGLTRGTDKLPITTLAHVCSLYAEMLKGSISQYKWSNSSGMGFKLLVDPGTDYDLAQDSTNINYRSYNSRSTGFDNWQIGRCYNHDVLDYSNLRRETAGGVASATGDVHNVLSLGKHFGIRSELGGLRFVVNGGEGREDSGNRLGKQCWIDYETTYAVTVQNGCAGVSILTAPTLIS